MDSHWQAAMDWDSTYDADPDNTGNQNKPSLTSGSFHCKSALRTHESNMKLFLYKKSFLQMRNFCSSDPYSEEAILLLPDFWTCFYKKTHGLDRILCHNTSLLHSKPSVAFSRWADYSLSSFASGEMIEEALSHEYQIWHTSMPHLTSYSVTLHPKIVRELSRMSYLIYFLNMTLVVLNHISVDTRPDISVSLPGICYVIGDNLIQVRYNDFLSVVICGQCVRVVTPIFDQILQKDLYLNLCDKINERFNTILGAITISYIAECNKADYDESDALLKRAVDSVLDWGDKMLYRHYNMAYDLIANYEAFCVSSILTFDNPDVWDNHEFQRNLLEDIRKNSPPLYPGACELVELLSGFSEQQLGELHGLWRLWGHPIIDLEGGLRKMETTCLKQANVDKKETLIGERTFKLTFMKNYYKTHHHYPLTTLTSKDKYDGYKDYLQERDKEEYESAQNRELPSSYIHDCIRKERKINEKSSLYHHEHWDDVTILQSIQVPQSINLATMIKDKAISMTRSELSEAVQLRNSVFDPLKRRGVLKWMSEQTHKVKDYLYGIDEDGLREDDRIIGLYPKERELKTKARFFSLMAYNMRMYITATEELLGKYLLKYFPMITMSDTLLNMIIRLYNMTTNIGAGKSRVTYSMNIDFSKWNQNMRERTNAQIFKNIDRILGFRNVISRTHSIFKESYLYLCSGEYVPDIIRGGLTALSPYSRIGDESGKEGLRQKGWTITTVCDIISLAFQHNVKIELIGGGDNQVLTVEIASYLKDEKRSPQEQMASIRSRMIRFRNALAKKMDRRGLPLKLEETWISHRLLMYNKIMYLDGVPLRGRLKVISRMFSNSNEGITSLGSITSTLGTGFQSLSSKDYTPILSWVVSRVLLYFNLGQFYLANPISGTRRIDQQILMCIDNLKRDRSIFGVPDSPKQLATNHKKIISATTNHTLSLQELYVICLYYHKILGGPGIGTPLAYIMKGFPDPLSEALAFNYSVIRSHPNTRWSQYVRNLSMVEKASVKHWEHLLEDPVSINHNAPSHGLASLRSQAEQIMREADIQNVAFKELINIGDNQYLRDLSESLCSTVSIEPRLLHDVVGSTIPGYVNTILSKVDQSSTLCKLASDRDVIASVYESEMLYYIYMAQKVKIPSGHNIGDCATTDSRMLRNFTWDRNIIGVTTPHPFAFLQPVQHNSDDGSCDHNYIMIQVNRAQSCHKLKRGKFRPYFGSYTEEKFKTSILASAYGDEDLLKRALKIQKLLGWRYKKGDYMYSMIQGILSCITNADPNKFLPTLEEITGDVEHRYHDMATKHGGIPSNLIHLYTHASCNTTTFINHSKGAANESLHFQASIIYASMVSLIMTHDESVCSKIFHFHETCSQCIRPIDSPSEGDVLKDGVSLMTCPSNDLMYIKEEEIPVHYHNHIAFDKDKKKDGLKKTPDFHHIMSADTARQTWILALAAQNIIDPTAIKKSAWNLYCERMTIHELFIIAHSKIMYNKLDKGLPWGTFDPEDVLELLMGDTQTLKMIFNSGEVRRTALDEGLIIPNLEDPISCVYDMMAWLKHMECGIDDISDALVKYQDPFFGVSRVLKFGILNPSTRTCLNCADLCRRMKSENPYTESCSNHGKFNVDISYHLHSIDRLTKIMAPAIQRDRDTEDQEPAHKRQKVSALYKRMEEALARSKAKASEKRKESFLLSKTTKRGLIKEMIKPWDAYTVSYEDVEDDDLVISGGDMDVTADLDIDMPEQVVTVINECHAILSIIQIVVQLREGLDVTKPISACYEITTEGAVLQPLLKVLYMLNNALSKMKMQINLTFVICQDSSAEDINLTTLEDIVHEYNHSTIGLTRSITLIERGDAQLDYQKSLINKDVIILKTGRALPFLKRSNVAYFVSNISNVYRLIGDLEGIQIDEYRFRVMIPRTYMTPVCPAVLQVTRTPHAGRVSSGVLANIIQTHNRRMDDSLTANIISSTQINYEHDIVYCIYNKLVRAKAGVISKDMMDTIIKQLGHGMMSHALSSNVGDPMSWKNILVIKIIIAIMILCDKDRDDALRYYSQYQSVSYKPGTYKTIILHRGCTISKKQGYFVNLTQGILGKRLEGVVRSVSGWLEVSWKESEIRSNKIVIM